MAEIGFDEHIADSVHLIVSGGDRYHSPSFDSELRQLRSMLKSVLIYEVEKAIMIKEEQQ
ncbi:hypothetical protein CL620_06200 [archaeon]|jgi:hypothetical protein|nr:hypothetical protein [archaeon]|tara:strand:- start:2950 stop:3129 length:180 start_codon:yes stop_codon:yes gene_type:complete